METVQKMQPPDHHNQSVARCPQCLRETMISAPTGGLRCTNASCRSEWPPRMFGCLLAAMFVFALVMGSTGCGAVEQHDADKAQEARLAELERRIEERDARIKELVAWVVEQIARARRAIADARRALEGR